MKQRPRKRKGVAGPNIPPGHPDLLSIKAGDMPWKTTARDFPLQAYAEAISKLHAQGYSYADIAAWLNGQLAAQLGHRRIGRGQVYRIYRQWLRDMEDGGRGIPTARDPRWGCPGGGGGRWRTGAGESPRGIPRRSAMRLRRPRRRSPTGTWPNPSGRRGPMNSTEAIPSSAMSGAARTHLGGAVRDGAPRRPDALPPERHDPHPRTA